MPWEYEFSTPPGLSLADKIERLFATMHPKERGEFTYREVADGIRTLLAERGERDGSLSPSYICQLRKGRRSNPTLRQVEMLAAFFKVPVTYFVGSPSDVEAIDAQLSLVRVLRDHDVRDIALRASALTPAGLRAVAEVITTLQGVPGLSRRRHRAQAVIEASQGRHDDGDEP
jgi:transcriptional regulator with XRE-family HTH domain